MDLKYRVLWFDDQPDQMRGVADTIRARLELQGLELQIRWVPRLDEETLEEIFSELRENSPYDIILVDYDLGKDKQKGDALLKRLRFYTNGEMIFYSADPAKKLRTLLLENNVDGVYCLCRDAKLGGAVYSIIESTLRRFFHPNYMRGLVVGSVSELEDRFGAMVVSLMKLPNMPSPEEVKSYILESNKVHLEEELRKLGEAENVPLDRLVKRANLRVKVELLLSLLERNGGRVALSCRDVIGRFLDEVNSPRIEFAHARTEEEKGFPVFKDRQGKVWKHGQMKQLVRTLREHKNAVRQLEDVKDD